MCLDYLYCDEVKQEWLDEQPEIITCYKGVLVRKDGQFAPLVRYHKRAFKRHNKIGPYARRKNLVRDVMDGHDNFMWVTPDPCKPTGVFALTTTYKPYFHLFLEKMAAQNYWAYLIKIAESQSSAAIVKCLVRKEHITAYGKDSQQYAIVATEFEIVGKV